LEVKLLRHNNTTQLAEELSRKEAAVSERQQSSRIHDKTGLFVLVLAKSWIGGPPSVVKSSPASLRPTNAKRPKLPVCCQINTKQL
jgi:hypothetical protein